LQRVAGVVKNCDKWKVSSFLNSSNLFVIIGVPAMQADSDLERNETESRVVRVSGHVEDPGDQAAGPLHAHYSNLYLFCLHPMAFASCVVICPCASTSLPALPMPLCNHFSTSSPFVLVHPLLYQHSLCPCASTPLPATLCPVHPLLYQLSLCPCASTSLPVLPMSLCIHFSTSSP